MRFVSPLVLVLAACSASSSPDAGASDLGADAYVPADSATDARASDLGVADAPDATVVLDGGMDMSTDAAIDLDAIDATAMDASFDADLDAGLADALVGDGSPWASFTTTMPTPTCTVTRGDTISHSALHVPICSVITTWETTPPCHGDHYPIWADFKTYDAPVPWGFLVHAMEHGAVVFAYSCGATCAAELQAFIDGYPADPLCSAGASRSRMILVPDPTLTVPIAIASWTHLYTATCFDLPSIQSFVDDTSAMAPEDFCSAGVDYSTADGGWCPPAVDAGPDGG